MISSGMRRSLERKLSYMYSGTSFQNNQIPGCLTPIFCKGWQESVRYCDPEGLLWHKHKYSLIVVKEINKQTVKLPCIL